MEEKVLIKSEMDSRAKSLLFGIAGAILGVGLIALLSLFLMRDDYYACTGWECIFESKGDIEIYYPILIAGCVFLVMGLIFLFYFRALTKCALMVTEHIVKGKSIGGKEVSLPLNQISAYATKKWNSTIVVATSSGLTKFALIANYKEIGDVLSKLISNRQENTAKAGSTNSNMDDLVKLKNLLDSGIITQEEFDAKKNQLLGL